MVRLSGGMIHCDHATATPLRMRTPHTTPGHPAFRITRHARRPHRRYSHYPCCTTPAARAYTRHTVATPSHCAVAYLPLPTPPLTATPHTATHPLLPGLGDGAWPGLVMPGGRSGLLPFAAAPSQRLYFAHARLHTDTTGYSSRRQHPHHPYWWQTFWMTSDNVNKIGWWSWHDGSIQTLVT